MNEQVLSTSRNADVLYESNASRVLKLGEGAYAVESFGMLTLNGVTRAHTVSSQVTLGAYNLRVTGNFEIRQSSFEIAPVNVAGGPLTLRDELKFAFFILARQESGEELQTQETRGQRAS
jgi:polyisoprenoid-binding protein YceI